jgi:hypothetical protein
VRLDLNVGDRVRSVVDYRRGMEGVIEEIVGTEVRVRIESRMRDGSPCEVDCVFRDDEIERTAKG